MIEFSRNKKTGIVEIWKGGKKVGEIADMGDMIIKKQDDLKKKKDEKDK